MATKEKPPELKTELTDAVAAWRQQHKLREDDAVLLLVELFLIHQRHWDELRRKDLPTLELLRGDMARCAEAARSIQSQSAALLSALRQQAGNPARPSVPRMTAVWAAAASILAGYLLGRAWP